MLIRQEIEKLVKKAIKESFGLELEKIETERPKEEKFGDYSTNIALVLAKKLKKDPKEIAKITAQSLNHSINQSIFGKIEAAGPGFVNFFISENYLVKELAFILREKDSYGGSKVGRGRTIIIDYSSPNIAKPFGVGHLRSTIIGQSIYNIYEFLGWRCIGDNHLGDWGTQFGKLIYQIKEEKKSLKGLTIKDLEELYVEFHRQARENLELGEKAREWFKKLEEGDKEAREIWSWCVKISLKEFDSIYKLLNVKFDYVLGESFYEGMVKKVVEEALKKKIAVESQGALIVEYPNDEFPPLILLKSDGTTTYLTRDLATLKYRLKRWSPDLIVYEVGSDQRLYFKQLFRMAELLGWVDKEKPKLQHVAHGLIRFKEGKFSTRKGITIHLEGLLKEAIERARRIIDESDIVGGLSEREKEKLALGVGIGAVKYNDLSQHHSADIIFNWEKLLNLKGNSGPYLQYTFARCQSVLRKAKFNPSGRRNFALQKLREEEKNILRTIRFFPTVVQSAAENFSPNIICAFLFDLAQKYNLFYSLCPIVKAESKEIGILRLSLTSAVAQVIKNGLTLLGISSPPKM